MNRRTLYRRIRAATRKHNIKWRLDVGAIRGDFDRPGYHVCCCPITACCRVDPGYFGCYKGIGKQLGLSNEDIGKIANAADWKNNQIPFGQRTRRALLRATGLQEATL